MRYDAVIATLNRPETLARCLSMVERQTEPPVRVVVVDASDDHESVRRHVLQDRDRSIDWVFVPSNTKSLPYQRNLGLEHVDREVVLMPDDDSLLFPTAAAEIMSAYRADAAGQVAGVSAVGVPDSPLASTISNEQARSGTLKDRIEPMRNRLEAAFVPAPFNTFPRAAWTRLPTPGWVDGNQFALVPSVGGYRLSLRTEVVKQHPFDETLGYGIGYALHEDMELSMRLHRHGYLLVGAQQARVHHDVHPSRRAGGFNYGFCWIANYMYACRANMPAESESWKRDLPRFLRYKLALYGARAAVRRDPYSKDVLAGARAAWAERTALTDAEPGDLAVVYRALCDKHIQR